MLCDLVIKGIELKNISFVDHKNFLIKKIYIEGGIAQECIRLIALDIIAMDWAMNISGNIKCNEKYPINIIIDFFTHSSFLVTQEKINFIVSGYIGSTLYVISKFSGCINGNLILKIQLDKIDTPLNLILDIDSIDMHALFIDNISCLIKGLNVYFDGSVNNYRMNLGCVVSFSHFPSSFEVVVNSYGSLNDVIVSSLNIRGANDSRVNLMGIVKWQEVITWNVKLILKNIDFVQYDFIRPVNLWGEINIHGSISNWIGKLESFNFFLHGKVSNCHYLNFRGSFIRNIFNEWSIPECCLSIGQNILKIHGDFKYNSSIIAIIECLSINDIFPNLYGSISGSVIFSSFLGYYKCLINIFSKCFYWKEKILNIDRMVIQGNLLYKKVLEGNIECQLENFIYYTFCIPKLNLQITGDVKNHNLLLSVYNNFFDVSMQFRGFFDLTYKKWTGSIYKINVVKSQRNCCLDKKLLIFYRNLPNQLSICSDYLDQYVFQITFYRNLEGNKLQKFISCFEHVHLTIKHSCFINSLVVNNGKFIFLVDLLWNKKHGLLPSGTLSVLNRRMEWLHMSTVLQGRSIVTFVDFDINITLMEECLLCDLSFKVGDYGQCSGKLKIYLSDSYLLFGNLYISNIPLLYLNAFLEQSDVISGILNLCLRFSGSLVYPEVDGSINLENMILKSDDLPFVMMPSKIVLNFSKSHAILNGSIRTTRGVLYLTGNMYWSTLRAIYIYIRVIGSNVRLILSPTVQVDISPIIVFEITPLKFDIKGILNIPWGSIDIKENDLHDNFVNISSDEYIVAANSISTDNMCCDTRDKNNFLNKLVVNTILRFGDNVRIRSFGLDAKLNGNLEVIKDRHGLGLKGYISILRGSINIYGQSLFVKKGQLLFSGLIDNQPYLNIEAVCYSDFMQSTTSIDGIRITGFVPSPELEFFSNHLISRGSAISYIFCGQGLDVFSINTPTAIRSILVRLGLFHTKKFVKQIGSILKVKDLMLNTSGLGDASRITLSGYIAPGLQIKYSMSIFDSLVTMTTRYRVLPNLYLEVVSGGQTQIYNLIYHFKY